jgi:hypothetical protein
MQTGDVSCHAPRSPLLGSVRPSTGLAPWPQPDLGRGPAGQQRTKHASYIQRGNRGQNMHLIDTGKPSNAGGGGGG